MGYNEKSKFELLDLLISQAFMDDKVNTSKVEEISLELRTIPESEKSKFYEFVKGFLELGFRYGLDQNNIHLEDFQVIDQNEKDDIVKEIIEDEKIQIIESLTSFKDLFDKVKIVLKEYFMNYKGYFITELINSRTLGYKLIFFYESTYHVTPLKGRVNNQFDGDCEFVEFDTTKIIELDPDKNYLCIFLFMSKMNNKEGLKNLKTSIKSFIDTFEEFYYHSVTSKKDALLCENTNRKDDFVDEIDVVLSTYISNGKINFEEEKIIKKLCANFKSPLIFYKILSGGFSGSKVLEIRPKKTNNFENDKIYIIKYGYISDEKIKEEKDNFSEFIKGRKGFSSYTDATYEKTLHYEGILYNYAISENSKASYSFNDILTTKDSPYNDIESKNKVINKLFSSNEAFKNWREDYNERKTCKVGDLYIDFVSREKIESSLNYILNDEHKINSMLENFDKISNHEIQYKETVCHGDLHTDNFFIDDEENIYLIDFGFTNKRHSILDYTSLECSLKFKHFPFYLESNELIDIEKELLLDKSFQLNYNFLSTNRKEVKEILSMINTVRLNSIIDLADDANNIEYFISLYLMTIRQIRYPNMNQLYAYHSSKILGEFLVEELRL